MTVLDHQSGRFVALTHLIPESLSIGSLDRPNALVKPCLSYTDFNLMAGDYSTGSQRPGCQHVLEERDAVQSYHKVCTLQLNTILRLSLS